MEMSQYLEVFIEESREHIQSCNENLLKLENDPDNLELINEVFRSAHTLKGMSATMGFEDMANLTHQMENVLDGVRNGKYKFSSELLDIIFMAIDHLESMVNSIAAGGEGKEDVSDAINKLKMIESGKIVNQLDTTQTAEIDQANISKTNLNYDQFEITVLEQANEQGYKVYEVSVFIRPDCLLKAARVYMVFDVLEKIGDIIKSVPNVEQLEEEQFDNEFVVTIVTHDSIEDIEKKVMKVSEIEKVTVVPLKISDLKKVNNEDSSDEQKNVSQNVEGQKKKKLPLLRKQPIKKLHYQIRRSV